MKLYLLLLLILYIVPILFKSVYNIPCIHPRIHFWIKKKIDYVFQALIYNVLTIMLIHDNLFKKECEWLRSFKFLK
jgi:hypothetical protein